MKAGAVGTCKATKKMKEEKEKRQQFCLPQGRPSTMASSLGYAVGFIASSHGFDASFRDASFRDCSATFNSKFAD